MKLCLGVLDGIPYIGLFTKPLLIIFEDMSFPQCRSYIVVIMVGLIASRIWGRGINWSHQHRILHVVTHKLNIDQVLVSK